MTGDITDERLIQLSKNLEESAGYFRKLLMLKRHDSSLVESAGKTEAELTFAEDAAEALRELQRLRVKASGVTHHADCWDDGPEHYQCALNEIMRLKKGIEEIHNCLQYSPREGTIGELKGAVRAGAAAYRLHTGVDPYDPGDHKEWYEHDA